MASTTAMLLGALAKLHDLVVVLDAEGTVVDVSTSATAGNSWLAGLRSGRRLAEQVEPSLWSRIEPLWRAVREGERTVSGSFPDGSFLSPGAPMSERMLRIELTSVPGSDEYLLLGSLQPETSRPLESFEAILDAIGQPVIVHGSMGEFRLANSAARALFEVEDAPPSPEAAHWRMFDGHGEPWKPEDDPVRRVLTEKRAIAPLTVHVVRPAKPDLWIEVQGSPVLSPAGEVELVVCSLTDITAKRETLAELQREHELLEQVMQTSVAGIMVLGPDGTITFANRAAEAIMGLTPRELVSRKYDAPEWKATGLDGSPWPDEAQPFQIVMRTKEPVLDVRHCIEWPDGTRKALSINGAPILNEAGEVERLVFAVLDITEHTNQGLERERLQAEMERVARLESLSVLAGGVAHDFNNLLIGILTAAGLALDAMAPDDPVREEVLLIEDTAKRAAELTRQLLAYSGRGRFVVGPTDVTRLVRGMSELLLALVSKGVDLRFECERGLPLVDADATQLRQVVMNLVLNASDAMSDGGGKIVVRTGRGSVNRAYLDSTVTDGEGVEPGEYVWVEVSDDGCGMPADTRTRMFDPFFTTKRTGHGLGLAAVLGVVRGHHGFVRVQSEAGQGTIVRIGLPAIHSAMPELRQPSAVMGSSRLQGTFLIIDDEELVRNLSGRLVERAGGRVLLAEDGEEGIALFKARKDEITAVVLDLTMPKMRGDLVLGEIRAIDPDVPVVLMSGYVDAGRISAGDAKTRFLAKPFRPAELSGTLAEVIGAA